MWLIEKFLPQFEFVLPYNRIMFWVIFACGLSILTSGAANIFRNKTVIHPNRESLPKATALVRTGIFRYTRNPIYLGMVIMLVAWLMLLENWLSAVGPVIFVAFITRYQIMPEEEALEKIFGEAYISYKANTRRWI